MLTLFYSPHSTSVDNEARLASGHADVPLSAVGREQARELGRHLHDKIGRPQALNAVFCSDLQRASATAAIAFETRAMASMAPLASSARGLPIVPDARLREYDYGAMTQYPVAQVEAEFARRITEPFPGGESLLMVAQRMETFLRDALREYDGKTIVVIGHRATRYALEYWCNNASLEDIVSAPWPWLDVPIWRYELHKRDLERRSIGG
ncbi:MAG: histidine phosphatase family protein [Ktedonobacteraceae bacterium]